MKRLEASKARAGLADALNRVAEEGERFLICRRGKGVAALVPVEDLDLLQELEDRMDLRDARAALREVRKKGTVPWEKIK